MGFNRYYDGYGFRTYVSAAQRSTQAARAAKALEQKRGRPLTPIKIEGRLIARSFWGKAWCDNLEAYSDYANRLPRGRTYVRNGSVIDLEIHPGKITALVSGSEIYEQTITIRKLPDETWQTIQCDCARSITSLVDLLQGRFDRRVMERLTQKDGGLFPKPREIQLSCSCPDWAGMCKHVAAVMYGVGARLDQSPELLFTLREVNHLDLIAQAMAEENLNQALTSRSDDTLQGDDLAQIFGIELETLAEAAVAPPESPARTRRRTTTPVEPAVSSKTKAPARRRSVAKSVPEAEKKTRPPAKASSATGKTTTGRKRVAKSPAVTDQPRPRRR